MNFQEHTEFLKEELNKIENSNDKVLMTQRADDLLLRYDGKDKIITSAEIVSELEDKPLSKPITTGQKGLDDIIRGFHPGQLILLTGTPGSGKTSFCFNLVEETAEHNPTLILLEQPPREMVALMQERGLYIPHFITPRFNEKATMTWIQERATEAVIKYNTKILFIDHFQLLHADDGERYFSEKNMIDRMLERLKIMAGLLNIPIVLITHLRKLKNPTDIPTVQDIQGSAGFDQLADTIMILWREKYLKEKEVITTSNTLLMVQKNRRYGNTGSFRLRYEDYKFIEDPTIEFDYENGNNDFGAFTDA